MANVELKKDFKDGQFLYGDDLNNNFKVIEVGINANEKELSNYMHDASEKLKEDLMAITAQRGWDWENSKGERVTFYKGNTNQINNHTSPLGQLLYNTETGETYLNSNGELILTGSGNILKVSEEEPTNPGTKVWIKPNELPKVESTKVIDSLKGNETNFAPSVNAVKKALSYSTEEQVVGTWIDGKPIYRKVFIVTSLPNATVMPIQTDLDNIKVTKIYGEANDSNGNTLPLPHVGVFTPNSSIEIAWLGISKQIRIATQSDRSSYSANIILEYIKTTD